MKTIKFRGKRLDNQKWVCGDLIQDRYGMFFIQYITKTTLFGPFSPEGKDATERHKVRINPETIGQFIGIHDKNGREIYEGDIAQANWYSYNEPIEDAFGEITYFPGTCSFVIFDKESKDSWDISSNGVYHFDIEVIGNIHDNPEILAT